MKNWSLIVIFLLGFNFYAFSQQGETSLGGSIGFGTGDYNKTLGITFNYNYNLTNELQLSPSFTYFFAGDGNSRFQVDADFHYLIPISERTTFFPIVGLDYSMVDDYRRLGMNVGLGVSQSLTERIDITFKARYTLMKNIDQLYLGVGTAYNF